MQLGELQGQISRFQARKVSIVALSVDPVRDSRTIVRRLKLSFDIVSDQDQGIMKSFGVQNPSTNQLALHAVFIVNENRQVFYRKIASRRPRSQELLDAIDYHYGRFPVIDEKVISGDLVVAYPRNNSQALIEIAAVDQLPAGVPTDSLRQIVTLLRRGQTDDSIIAFRRLLTTQGVVVQREQYFAVAAWLTQQALQINPDAIEAGKSLRRILSELSVIRSQTDASTSGELQQLQNELDKIRGVIRQSAGEWQLRYAKTMLRGYRELVIAVTTD